MQSTEFRNTKRSPAAVTSTGRVAPAIESPCTVTSGPSTSSVVAAPFWRARMPGSVSGSASSAQPSIVTASVIRNG